MNFVRSADLPGHYDVLDLDGPTRGMLGELLRMNRVTHLTGFSVEVLGVQKPFRGFFLLYQRRFFRLRHYFAFAEIFDDVESLIPEVVESHICRRTSAPFTQMLLNFARTTLDTVQGSFQTTVGIRHSTCDDGTLQFHHHCRVQNINGI